MANKTAKKIKSKPAYKPVKEIEVADQRRGYLRFKLKRREGGAKPVPTGWKLLKTSSTFLFDNWRVLGAIILIYAVLTLLLVRGFSVLNLTDLRQTVADSLGNDSNTAVINFALFGVLLGSAASGGDTAAGAYQTILMIIASLATIWALRQIQAEKPVTAKLAFYRGMQPLVPFTLILIVIALELIPLLIGGALYNTVLQNSINTSVVETVVVAAVFLFLCSVSLLLMASTLMALYIVSLPGVMPLQALRSARKLVVKRRLAVMSRLAFLVLFGLFMASVLLLPLIFIALPLAEPMLFTLSIIGLVFFHVYMYHLYRSLLL